MKSVVAKWKGVVLAASNATVMLEGNHYFPPGSLVSAQFTASETSTNCPWKGDAAYLSAVVDGEVNPDCCWYYPEPTSAAARIRGYYAFWRGVEIIQESAADREARLPAGLREQLAELDPDLLLHALPEQVVQSLSFFNFSNSTTACFLADMDFRIHTVNPTFGWTFAAEDGAVGSTLFEFLAGLGIGEAEVAPIRQKLESHGWVKVPEIAVERTGQEPKCYSLDAVVTRHGDLGSLAGLQGQFVDITNEVKATRALQAMKDHLTELVEQRTQALTDTLSQLEGILNSISDALMVTDSQGAVRRLNPAAKRMFGISEQRSGQALPPALLKLWADTMGSGQGVSAEVRLPNGGVGKAVASPLGGDAQGAVTVVRDISFEKEVDRMKTDFIANVSHELRTPLTSILGFANLIDKRLDLLLPLIETSDPRTERAREQVRGNLAIIVSESERLTRIINDVLDIAKMEAGKTDWQSDSVPLPDLVRRAIEATRGLFADSPVSIEYDQIGDPPDLIGDAGRLTQVVVNLISNASKFTTEGRVTCRVEDLADRVRVSVVDTGSGVPAEHRDAVFDKFAQVGDTLTDKPIGTGLGLPLCRHVVQHHRGRIWVEDGENGGAAFCFELPKPGEGAAHLLLRHVARAMGPLTRDISEETESAARKVVLVVDDDAAIRELLRQELKGEGYAVREASDGAEALAAVKQHHIDLVVLDVMMPAVGGFDVAAALKGSPETSQLPIVIHTVVQDRARGLSLGVDRYIEKSGDLGELLEAVGSLLDRGTSGKRVLVVDSDQDSASSLVGVLGSLGYTATSASSAEEALRHAGETDSDVVILDKAFPNRSELRQSLAFKSQSADLWVIVLGKGER